MTSAGLENYQLAIEAIRLAPSDPEDTLMVQFTKQDLCVFLFGSMLINSLFPEMVFEVDDLWSKVDELSDAQSFLPGRYPAQDA